MAPYFFIPAVVVIAVLLIRIAVAAWLTRPGSKRDPDAFLRVFNGLKSFDAMVGLIQSWGNRMKKEDSASQQDE